MATPSIEELIEGLNDAQVEAVATLEGPVLIVAGPGSGKTRVLTHRVGALLSTGVPPWRILAVTFTNKAAGEMRERLDRLVGEVAKDLWVSTFHSLCVKLLRRYASYVGLEPGFTILDQDDATKIMKAAVLACGVAAEDTKKMLRLVSYAKNNLMAASDVEDAPLKLGAVAKEYEDRKARAGVVDFDDLLTLVWRLCGNEEVAKELRAKFSYVLVDEYQDTNRVQYEILRALTWESRNLCVVGDEQQAIYRFRGSFPGIVTMFLGDYSEAKVIKLGQNYRSTKRVVALSAAIIAGNPSGERANLWTENDTGDFVRLVSVADDREEAAWVVADSAKHAGSTAIIVRTNAQTKPFEDALMTSRVSFQLVGAQRFFDRAEVRDTMAWLRGALNPGDYLALTRAAGAPKRGLGEKTLAEWFELANQQGMSPLALARDEDALGVLSTRGARLVAEFAGDVERVASAAMGGPEAAIKAVISVGLLKDMERERQENVNQLLSSAADFMGDAKGSFEMTQEFVESIALTGAVDAGVSESATAPLFLITAHAAKGREFDNVYVVGVEEGIYPHAKSEDDLSVQEERRLLFVAASRARTHLTLSWCGRRNRFGKYEDAYPSPFLEGLEEHVSEISIESTRRDAWGGTPRYNPGPKSKVTPAPGGFRLAAGSQRVRAVVVDSSLYPVGAWVVHPRFGRGQILSTGDNIKVRFSDQTRVLALAYAKLEVETTP